MTKNIHTEIDSDTMEQKKSAVGRRSFLRTAGLAASVGAAMAACTMEDHPNPSENTVKLGKGDVGVLNYAYALEQLEAAFYTQVVADFASDLTEKDKAILTDIRDHEIIHRDFFKAALTAAAPNDIIPGLTPDFSTIDFKTRAGVLGAAKLFENTGVAAYNGAGKLIKTAAYLVIAGQIVSVEARHASVISDLLDPFTDSFAGMEIDANGLDKAIAPADILAAIKGYVKETLDGSMIGQ